jgi:hypothetical protein
LSFRVRSEVAEGSSNLRHQNECSSRVGAAAASVMKNFIYFL